MKNRLNLIFPEIQELRDCYRGSETSITDDIIADVNMMVDTAMLTTYNRLRHILHCYKSDVFFAQMNPRSPLSNRYKFPAFISSVLGSIGPLHINNGLKATYIVYATSADRSQNYGRAEPFDFDCGQFFRFIDKLAAIGVPLAPIHVKAADWEGSFFSTIIPTRENGLWYFTATFDPSHYKHHDIVSAWLTLDEDPDLRAFEDCSLTIGRCTDPAVVDAVLSARSENVTDDRNGTTGSTRLVGGIFPVNGYGIRPAIGATDVILRSWLLFT